MSKFQISNDDLGRIFEAHGLGKIHSINWATRGMNNPVFIINDRYVIRFDGLEHTGRSRFFGEKLAYEKLRENSIPAPEVIALDVSRTLAAQDYIILSKIEGRPVIDDWNDLSAAQKEQVGTESGRYLAMMHEITFTGCGQILKPENERFPSWYAYVMDYLEEYGEEGIKRQVLTAEQRDEILTIFERHKTMLEAIAPARLVHWDYHFENIMQQNGHVTGILDFEWALAGDAMYDFKLRDYWDEICPGSSPLVFRGYTDWRALPDDYELKVLLYTVMMTLDYAVDTPDEKQRKRAYEQLQAALKAVR